MRMALTLLIGFVVLVALDRLELQAAPAPKRYGIEADLETYPQSAPKETLASVLQAIDRKRIDYLLAQLADPEFVDMRVQKAYAGQFDDFVKESTAKLVSDPTAVKKLRRFLNEGEWDVEESAATGRLKDVRERVYLRKIEGRWYFEDRNKPNK